MTGPRLTSPDDRYRDFCLRDYTPAADPSGKLRSDDFLRASFELAGVGNEGDALCEDLRSALGQGATVWGVKAAAGAISWEFYFYDYGRRHRKLDVPAVLAAARLDPRDVVLPDPDGDWFMCSVELTADLLGGDRRIGPVDIYVDNPTFDGNSGCCHELTSEGPELKNVYYFFEPRHGRAPAIKLGRSVHMDGDARVLAWERCEGMTTDSMVVVADKRRSDGIYYTRLDVSGLLAFLNRQVFPVRLVDYVRNNLDELSHLRWDVGFDFRRSGPLTEVTKAAVYGCL